ncbi:MAG TPA: SDR family oxidoreductase [Baekduia sp.]|uniref:SDR family oxidoreductase n=1 Tax=Baekduia sp. TaxID=2600305 RepID=UPI002C761714|nr:SDR family oxidoreductase [Baekduia sp.]HMJ35027.1 SDR family oxidoreductase [Baekduia sp.]
MDIVIAGGHGKIALHLEPLLVEAGHRVRGLIRNPAYAPDLEARGAEAVVADLEELDVDALAALLGSADAIVFAAGAGPGSGPQRKWTVDYAGAVKLMEVARRNGIDRYVMVGSMGADPDAEDDGGFGTYLRAKGQADLKLTESGLAYTIVRPGGLTDDLGTGHVTAAEHVDRGQIPRADVAAVLATVLATPGTAGLAFQLVSGDTPIPEAIARLARLRT